MKALVLPLLVLIGSLAWVYFTLEQQRMLDAERADINKTQSKNESVTATVDERRTQKKRSEELLEKTKATFYDVTEKLRTAKLDADTIRRETGEVNEFLAKYERQKKEFDDTSAQVEAMAKEMGESFTIDNIEQFKTDMKGRKDKRVARVDELDTLITGAEKSIADNKSELARQVQREEDRQMKISRSSLEAVITGVNQDWGFLVIGAGSNSGFTPQSALLVERDGRMIAKVRPSSIEPTQTIAEINFDSLAPGVRIQPGDKVIFKNPTTD